MSKKKKAPLRPEAFQSGSALELLDSARRSLQGGDTVRAVSLYNMLVTRSETRAAASFGLAQALWQQGHLTQAMVWARSAAEHPQATPEAHVLYCRGLRQARQHSLAVAHALRALEQHPGNIGLMVALALAQRESGDTDGAESTYLAALNLAPKEPALHQNLANLRQVKGQLSAAEAGYREVLALQPGDLRALFELGNVLLKQARASEASPCFQQVVQADPRAAAAWRQLGAAEMQLVNPQGAAECFAQVLALEPADPNTWLALARAKASFDPQGSLTALEQVLQLRPDDPDALKELSQQAMATGDMALAYGSLRRLVEISPDQPDMYFALAQCCYALGRVDETLASVARALAMQPGRDVSAECFYLQAVARLDSGDIDGAHAGAEALQALAQNGFEQCAANELLATTQLHMGRLQEAVAGYHLALAAQPESFSVRAALCAAGHYIEQSPQLLRQQAVSLMAPFNQTTPPAYWPNERDPGRVIRVGVVSGDLRRHSCAFFLSPWWRARNRDRTLLIAYATSAQSDEVTGVLRECVDLWRDVPHLSAAQLRQQIRDDGVDVLMDLSGYTDGGRLEALSVRSAPVQCTWLGYLGTTALHSMDYRITDAWVTPEGAERGFTERSLRLRRPYLCYEPDPAAPAVGPLPMLKRGYPTLASFNVLQKVGDASVALWAKLLRAMPTARMIIKTRALNSASARQHLLALFAREGVDAARLDLLPWMMDCGHHLGLYGQVDIALDTFPYNGVTTTCEALWMGVPVVSRVGETPASRQGLTLLQAVGLPEFAVSSEDDFVAQCQRLVADPHGLAGLRAALRSRMANSDLMNAADFAQEMDKALTKMWALYCRFDVSLKE